SLGIAGMYYTHGGSFRFLSFDSRLEVSDGIRCLSETPCDLSQGFLHHQHRFRCLWGGNRLLVWIGKTFGRTRSNSRDSEAAQEALRTRMFSGRFQGGRQARLHALPVSAQLAPGRDGEFDRIEHAGQPGTIQVPLDECLLAEPTVRAAMEPQRKWF